MLLSAKLIRHAIDSGLWNVGKPGFWGCNRCLKVMKADDLTIGPNSLDVTLGDEFLFKRQTLLGRVTRLLKRNSRNVYIFPGEFVIAHISESIDCTRPLFINGRDHWFVPMLEGRSTVARMGLSIHESAGFGDYGFKAPWVLELSAKMPVTLQPGMRIAQVFFTELLVEDGTEPECYDGAYKNQTGAQGAVLGKGRF